ncbi:efflux RND transporter periplasmic adaptor subunit [Pantoea coffeiphila]|uniref:Efflux transporter periplasmic adaptor subunit n=1 Tax=Pantoea coffeiphila TaxID=1465635 RepID=A0A2S9I664_9GAMM|nr:HlyD family secretion protein [Pantoea coffeiphila]PRD13275.1 efflux transporter periplasmic adaptor subunit [Pantoea coffeiphila]
MKLNSIKYFSTLIVFAAALCAAWWLWNYYMQSPWTRDGKVRAELVNITPQVSGRIMHLYVEDNQFVSKGTKLFSLDDDPYRIAEATAESQLAKAQSDLVKAQHEARRRQDLPRNVISAEALDEANLAVKSMEASEKTAQSQLNQARWELSQTNVYAPVDGWINNLVTRVGDYASSGSPLFALVDSHSFYVMGYFEETKLRHIRPGATARLRLYSDDRELGGVVASIGRAIYDQSVETDSGLVPDIKPNVPWVRLAQRVPVRIRLTDIPPDLPLVAGTTVTISLQH